MNNKFLAIIIMAIIVLLSVSPVNAALSIGSWTANNAVSYSINNGENAEFTYGITAVTSMGGKYSVYLTNSNNQIIKTYYTNQITLDNGAVGWITINPSDYKNTAGTYYVIIDSSDTFGTNSYKLTLIVNPVIIQNPLTITCSTDKMSGTTPLNIAFTSNANGGSGSYSYKWTFGNGATSLTTSSSTSYSYSTAGTYNTQVTVTDTAGKTATATCGQIVAKAPTQALSVTCNANPRTGTSPLNVGFTSIVSGETGSYIYTWTFGDGTTSSNIQSTSKTYNNQGTYSTSLTVKDSSGTAIAANCGQITVEAPVAPISGTCNANPTTGDSPLNVQFTSSITGGSGTYTYNWIFGDGQTATTTTSSKSYTYNNVGTYYSKIHVTDTKGNTATINCGTITTQTPIAPITATCSVDKTSGTSPLYTSFTSSVSGGTGIYTYTWMYGDGTTSNSQRISTHTYNYAGTYNAQLKITDTNGNTVTTNCGTITTTNPVPELTITCSANPTYGTTPLNVQFTANANGGTGTYNYKWSFGDGITATSSYSTKSYVYNNAGTYNTQVIVTDGAGKTVTANCGSITTSHPVDQLTASCAATPTSGTSPLTVSLNSQATGGSGTYTYTWTFGDGTTSTTSYGSKSYVYNNAGIYNTQVTVKDTTGKSTTVNCGSISVNNPIPPLSTICSVNPTSGTSPLNVQFNTITTGGTGTYTYKWLLGDGTSSTGTSSSKLYTYNYQGSYNTQVQVTDAAGKIATAVCGTVNVNNPVIPLVATCTANPTTGDSPLYVQFVGTATGGTGVYTYKWNFGDNIYAQTAGTVSHIYNNIGTYYPKLTVEDNAGKTITVNCGTITTKTPISPITGTCAVNPTSGTTPLYTTFTSSINGGTGTYTYTWMYGDGTTSNTHQTSSKTYNYAGTYNTQLKITDTNGNTATINCGTVSVTNPIPQLTTSCSATPTSGTTPLNVNFNSQTTGGSGQYIYEWTFGDNTQSYTTQTAIHTYSNAGTYNTQLKVRDSLGNTATANCGNINVNNPIPQLTATCSATPTSGTTPLNVNFNSQVNGGTGAYTYKWNFGDNTNSYNYGSTSKTYNNAGTYYTTLTVTDAAGKTATANCGIITTTNPAPTPIPISCSSYPTEGFSPLEVTLKAQVTGSSTYTYSWTFGDGLTGTTPSTINTNVQIKHTYNVGTYAPKVTVTDTNGNTGTANCAASSGINVQKPTLTINSINCFPRIASGKTQSCSVSLISNNGIIPGGVDVDIYYSNGIPFGSCITNSLSGACEVQQEISTAGKYTVYATAQKTGYNNDMDTYPRYTFDVLEQRYEILNLGTYNDSNFYYLDSVFYRGEPLYVKFQVYDPLTNTFVTGDIVTAASLVSQPGGRADLNRMTYNGNWYYYKLAQIPLNHDFLGGSNVFAFAFNFTEMTAGQAQVTLTILNNEPKINNIPDVYLDVGSSKIIDLDSYGVDLEDNPLRYIISSPSSSGYSATIENIGNLLSIKGLVSGTYTLTIKGYDLDNAYATKTINIYVLPMLSATCSATPKSGTSPLNVQFNSQITGGNGQYTYTWTFGDNTQSYTTQTATHTYNNAGTYNAQLTVRDSNGKTSTVNCGQIVVDAPLTPITGTCTVTPTSGTTPLYTSFTSSINGGTGTYTYTWMYGDGTTSNTHQTSSKTYNYAGTYNTQLKITDTNGNTATFNCGTVSVTNPIPQLTATCSATPTSGTTPLNVNFNSQVNGGTGTYTYKWNFGDNTNSYNSGSTSKTYSNAGTYYTTLIVTDGAGKTATANCGNINVKNPVVPILKVNSINCFPRIIEGHNQSCSVQLISDNGIIPGGAEVTIKYLDGTIFGTCITDSLSGGCEVEKEIDNIGTYTVYATATKTGYTSDTDTYPRYTFDVIKQRYDILNLGTYNDKQFLNPDSVFYRGEALYVKFQIYDPITNTYVTNDIVTAAALVSQPGGRAELNKLTQNGNWYYYELEQIPLNHDFLGGSNVFAFAFNFTEMTGGQAQVTLTILNNNPTIQEIPEVYVNVDSTNIIDLDSYGIDLEDTPLRYIISSPTSTGYTATINNIGNLLSITGKIPGDYTATIKGYDLDNAYTAKTIIIHVIKPIVIEPLTATCTVDKTSGEKPLNVQFTALASGGNGTYTYDWTFADGTATTTLSSSTSHIYNNAGAYVTTVIVRDSNGKSVTANCGQIIVNNPLPPLAATCTVDKTSGESPLAVAFTSTATGGTGIYTYSFTFGDNSAVATSSIATHTYTTGIYNPNLVVRDSKGNTITASCGQINAIKPYEPVELDVSCVALPSVGKAPLDVTYIVTVSGGNGINTYTYNFDETNTLTSNFGSTTFRYTNIGTYNPSVHVIDTLMNHGTATCGLIIAQDPRPANVTLIAEANGPYNGFINEDITFNAVGSLSSEGIVSYVWNFGDGTTTTTTNPTVTHKYSKIARYDVTLKIIDIWGYEDTDVTTALVIERTNYTRKVYEDLPDKGLSVTNLNVYGINGEIIRPNDDLTVSMNLKNVWNRKLENVRVIVSIPEYGFEARSSTFDLSKGSTKNVALMLPLEDLDKGMHYVKIYIVNDDDGEQVKRTKYREIIVR